MKIWARNCRGIIEIKTMFNIMRTMDKMLLWSSAWSEDEYWRNIEEQQKNED